MSDIIRPGAGWELQSVLESCISQSRPLEIAGAGSKRFVGRPMQTAMTLTTSSMRGIRLYEPTELVMTALAGTPVSQVEAVLAAQNQMLAFEPIDIGPTSGGELGEHTIGAAFATNLSGSRRIRSGGARDHLLGIEAVNGRAEVFRSGGRVMKNVTGYDLCRALTGSWGTLGILTEVTFKVLPWPEQCATLVYLGLPEEIAIEVLCSAMGSPYEVSGAIHLQDVVAARLETGVLRNEKTSVTCLRLEDFAGAVTYRKKALRELLQVYGEPMELDSSQSLGFWAELRRLSVMPCQQETCLWRISTLPTNGPKVVAAISRHMPAAAFYDWSGGMIWVEVPATADAGASDIRRAVAVNGGHATLIRAAPEVRANVEVFQPQAPAIEKLMRGLKSAFDPYNILNPGRMYATL